MPMYCYRDPRDGTIHDRHAAFGKAPDEIKLDDGTECLRCLPAEFASQSGMETGCWPMESQALAVHPDQRKQYGKFASEHGVPTHFDERGRPTFESRGHRKRYAELVGATDFEGGYSDPDCR